MRGKDTLPFEARWALSPITTAHTQLAGRTPCVCTHSLSLEAADNLFPGPLFPACRATSWGRLFIPAPDKKPEAASASLGLRDSWAPCVSPRGL